MSVEELKSQRDLASDKVERATEKLKKAVDSRNERMVKRSVEEMKTLFSKFEMLHVSYAAKTKTPVSAPELKELYNMLSDLVAETEDAALVFLEEIEDKKKEEEAAKDKQQQDAETKKKVKILIDDANREADMLAAHMMELADRMKGKGPTPWQPEPSVLLQETLFCEKRFEGIRKMMEEAAREASLDDERDQIMNDLMKLEMDFRKINMEVKSLGWQPSNSSTTTGDNGSAPQSLDSSTRSSGEREPEKFKNTKIDYPRFSGDVRQYLTFKRDFEEIVKRSGRYSNQEMSLILRNHCLQGKVKTDCQNITDYSLLESKLDEEYLDKERVVDMVTQQLTDTKPVRWDDYQGFIDLVNQVEMAHLDLTAIGNSNILNNPMSVRLIEGKCPDWVQKSLMTLKEESEVELGNEFAFLLAFLLRKRKEARRLLRLKESQKPAQSKGQPPPAANNNQRTGGFTHAAGGQPVHQRGNGGQQPSGAGGQQRQSNWKCIIADCKYSKKHFLSECRSFKRLDANGKGEVVVKNSLCVLCFGSSHAVAACPKRGQGWKECDAQNCGRWHSRYLHGAVVPGLVLAIPSAILENAAEPVLLLCQRTETAHGLPCLTFWDHGSTTALVTFSYAEKVGLKGVDCSFELTVVGDRKEIFNTKMYVVNLVDRHGEEHQVCAIGINRITTGMAVSGLDRVLKLFSCLSQQDVEPPVGEVDLLVGMGYVHLLPVRQQLVGQLAVYCSLFGTGFLLGGKHPDLRGMAVRDNFAHCVSYAEHKIIKPLDFFTAESFGVDVPRKCKSCQGCKECDFKVRSLTWNENMELKQIEQGLVLDPVAKTWTATYPTVKDPSELKNNYGQALSCMLSLEKRLKRNGQLDCFNEQFKDTVSRGVFRKLSKQEAEQYDGPINYITIVETYKPGPHSTTPIRLCMNSSMKFAGLSLNDVLVKGPSALNDIFGVTLSFRKFRVGFVKDLSKFYQSVKSCPRDQHLRRVIWREGDCQREPEIYVTTTVNFGDKPAGCVAQTAVRETARLYRHIDERAAELIQNSTFCDDTLGGGESREEAQRISASMDQIVAMGGFTYKDTVMSGDMKEPGDSVRKVLGLCWDEENDLLSVDIKINVSEKKKGVRMEPNVDLDFVDQQLPQVLTKRHVWRIVLGQYDLLGLVCVFTIQLKLILRELSMEQGRKLGWDEAIPEETRLKFLAILAKMKLLKNVTFPRCVIPTTEDRTKKPQLLCFADGSTAAFCTLVYGRWKLIDGSFACRLIAGKTRVAPLRKLSVPRLELLGAVASVRLAQQVEEFLGIDFETRYFFTDSSAVLGMVRSESTIFNEFVGSRVAEIKTKSEPAKEWHWLPTDQNLADLGTRDTVDPQDMMEGTVYQKGLEWMNKERSEWPVRQEFGKPPTEEFKQAGKCLAIKSKENFLDYQRFRTFSRLQRVVAYVFSS
jgi:Pao retrotransposon peptidase